MKLRDTKREEAAMLLSEDRLTDAQIAESVGITRKTLHKWKQRPEFSARVEDLTRIWSERALKFGLAKRERRLAVLEDQHNRLLTVIEERGASEDMQDVPGGKTGLLLRTYKGLGAGATARIVEEYAVDVATIRELRGIQEQFARELGQVVERVEVTHKPLYETTEELEAELARLLSKRAAGRPGEAPC